MGETIKKIGLFALQLPGLIAAPILLAWACTPTNVINSDLAGLALEKAGLASACYILSFGAAAGIIGIIVAVKCPGLFGKLRIPTIACALVNIASAVVEWGFLILLFAMTMLGFVHA